MSKIKFDTRIVVTCTTLPGRYDTLIRTLRNMHNQDCHIDQCYVTIPYKAARLNQVYPDIPDEMHQLAKVVRIETDYGPLCKMYGALFNEKDKNTIIISVDDDCIYPDHLISHLVKLSLQYSKVAICGTGALIGRGLLMASIHTNLKGADHFNFVSGFKIPKEGRCVDVIHGFAGVLYRRGFFPNNQKLLDTLFQYPFINKHVFCHDDLIISAFLKSRGIKLKTFKDIPIVADCVKNSDALSYDFLKMMEKFKKAIIGLQQHGLYQEFSPSSLDENPMMKFIYLVFLILVIFLFVYFMCYQYY
jgi:hypothetical protein